MSITTETTFTFAWAEDAIERIYNSSTLPEAITITAGFLTDIIDELHRLNDRDQNAEYLPFMEQTLAELDGSEHEDAWVFWTVAHEILELYRLLPRMAEWEIEFEATKRLAAFLDPNHCGIDEVWTMLGNVIAYLQGWTEGEAEGIREGSMETELLLAREWPSQFPEDRPPDGLEEYSKVGWE